jgi:hypothetical protein
MTRSVGLADGAGDAAMGVFWSFRGVEAAGSVRVVEAARVVTAASSGASTFEASAGASSDCAGVLGLGAGARGQ